MSLQLLCLVGQLQYVPYEGSNPFSAIQKTWPVTVWVSMYSCSAIQSAAASFIVPSALWKSRSSISSNVYCLVHFPSNAVALSRQALYQPKQTIHHVTVLSDDPDRKGRSYQPCCPLHKSHWQRKKRFHPSSVSCMSVKTVCAFFHQQSVTRAAPILKASAHSAGKMVS